ncbi:Hypothetical predicted protein [Marmota monax]|uniref:Uncharacterized protein n=1 Tax=Marmota monax TaxID=9995 RepID=A0A5E4CHC8_MARMO|nr:hypothetical protein GHT09_014388 [Marmota monax]VTJ81253.1 Hypothetical predicted protein [Marmota monax]
MDAPLHALHELAVAAHRLPMWSAGHGHGCRPCEIAGLGPALPNPAVPVTVAPTASQGAPSLKLGPGSRMLRGRLWEAPHSKDVQAHSGHSPKAATEGQSTDGPRGHMLVGLNGVSAKPEESSYSQQGGSTGLPPIGPSAGTLPPHTGPSSTSDCPPAG